MLTVSLFDTIWQKVHSGFRYPLQLKHPFRVQVCHSHSLALTLITRFTPCSGEAAALTLLSFYLFRGWIGTIAQASPCILFKTSNIFI